MTSNTAAPAARHVLLCLVALAATALAGCSPDGDADASVATSPSADATISLQPALRDVAPDGFFVGTIGSSGYPGHANPFMTDDAMRELTTTQFDSITPENQGKWESLRPSRDEFDFKGLHALVEFAEQNGMRVRGHNLMWHRQNPQWLLAGIADGSLTNDDLRAILHEHISTVVGRYKGRIAQWDVANEVIDDDGQWRQDNPWIAAFGPDIIADAFRWAHEADPDAQLFLNDYDVELDNAKFAAYAAFVPTLIDQGVPVDGFGFQGHLETAKGIPTALQANLQKMADLGLQVEITELDIRMPVGADGRGSDPDLATQSEMYQHVMASCLAIDKCTGVTLWGIGDRYSWVAQEFPGLGGATPFDVDLQPKPAFEAMRAALQAGRP